MDNSSPNDELKSEDSLQEGTTTKIHLYPNRQSIAINSDNLVESISVDNNKNGMKQEIEPENSSKYLLVVNNLTKKFGPLKTANKRIINEVNLRILPGRM